jgi:DNA-binding NarL/FixJ family response regulator
MIKENYSVLIIDDHPITVEGYKNVLEAFSLNNTDYKLKVVSAYSIDSTINKINGLNTKDAFDLILLDISMLPSTVHNIFSGEELGVYIKKKFPNTKIIVLTLLNDNLRLLNIFNSLNPDGFIIKCDLTSNSLLKAVKTVLKGNKYYSETINTLLLKKTRQKAMLYSIDIILLKELANGSKMKELLEFIPLTKSGIERRKRMLKKTFHAKTDRDLVITAREKGFI